MENKTGPKQIKEFVDKELQRIAKKDFSLKDCYPNLWFFSTGSDDDYNQYLLFSRRIEDLAVDDRDSYPDVIDQLMFSICEDDSRRVQAISTVLKYVFVDRFPSVNKIMEHTATLLSEYDEDLGVNVFRVIHINYFYELLYEGLRKLSEFENGIRNAINN